MLWASRASAFYELLCIFDQLSMGNTFGVVSFFILPRILDLLLVLVRVVILVFVVFVNPLCHATSKILSKIQ